MTDERAVSTVVSYVLTLGISSLLIVGLLVATSGYVDTQRQETIRDELEVVGQHIAADLSAADRLVDAGGETVEIRRNLPTDTTGITYNVDVQPGSPTTLVLSTSNPDIVVEVDVRTETDVVASTFGGGAVVIEYDVANDELEVDDA